MKNTPKISSILFGGVLLLVLSQVLSAQDSASSEVSIPKISGVVVSQSLKIDNVVPYPNYLGRQALQLTLTEPQEVNVTLVQKNGFPETTIFSGNLDAGTHYVMLPDKKMPRGEYFCFLKGKETDIKSLVLVREKAGFKTLP